MPFHGVPQKLARNSTALLLLAILCFGAWVRVGNLHNEQAWHDEIATIQHLHATSLGQYLELCRTQNPIHPPLYMICQFYWSRVFGSGEYAMRMMSIIPGMLCLGMIFLLTRVLYGSRAGLLSTAWLAFIPYHIQHAQQIRFYAFMTLFALLSMYLFLKLLQDGRKRWWVLLTAVDLAIVWNQPLGAALFLAQAVYLLVFYRKHVRLLAAWASQHLVIVATLLPWALRIDSKLGDSSTAWLSKPGIFGSGPTVEFFVANATGTRSTLPTNALGEALITYRPFFSLLIVLTYFLAIAYIVTVALRKKNPAQKPSDDEGHLTSQRSLVLVLSWLLVPPMTLFFLSYTWRPCFLHRYLIHSMLPLYILMGASLMLLKRPIRMYVIGALLLFNLAYQGAYNFPGPFRLQYATAAQLITDRHHEDERVIAITRTNVSAMRYRLDREGVHVTRLRAETDLLTELGGLAEDFVPRWVVLTSVETADRIASQCEAKGQACSFFDLTASRYLVVVHVAPDHTP